LHNGQALEYNFGMKESQSIDFVESIYRLKPNIKDQDVIALVSIFHQGSQGRIGNWPTMKTLSAWKSRLRKKGLQIPDLRHNNPGRPKGEDIPY